MINGIYVASYTSLRCANFQTCTIYSTRGSALSDIKCEAQAEHLISDKARLQVL